VKEWLAISNQWNEEVRLLRGSLLTIAAHQYTFFSVYWWAASLRVSLKTLYAALNDFDIE
jgi:hypothetical protein